MTVLAFVHWELMISDIKSYHKHLIQKLAELHNFTKMKGTTFILLIVQHQFREPDPFLGVALID